MKKVIQIILLIYPLLNYGQQTVCVYDDFKVLGNDTINRTANNVKDGIWVNYEVAFNSIHCFTSKSCYHQEAIRFINSRGEFSKGTKIGEWKYYYPTGELKRIDFLTEQGEKDGSSKEYYKNGNIRSRHNWQHNELELQFVYFDNGEIKYEAKFKGNTIESFKIFYKTGELKFLGSKIVDWKIENLTFYAKNGEEIKTRNKGLGELLSNEDLIEYL